MSRQARNIKPATVKAVAALTDALAQLRADLAEADHKAGQSAPGSKQERYALQLSRVVKHLGDSIADVPTDLWLAMCNLGGEQISKQQKSTEAMAA